ncbi:MAG: alcohol dehydrogenase family protein [Proteobacteria bacterium]|nr:alcohol dehydrogenase family protein [Pseudomonadota bacterium]
MRAVLLTGHGGPERLDYREDVAEPEPGAGEVLIAVGAAAINNTDIWTREGAYGSADDPAAVSGWRREPMAFPRIQGADVAGRIVAVGAGVPETRIGERVIVNPVLYSELGDGLVGMGYLGSERDGGFAEFVAVPAANALAIESDLGDAELASFPTAYLTAEGMLDRARVAAGETLLVTGASGGVGSALVQLARARDARVVALAGRGKEARLRDLGAELVLTRQAGDPVAQLGAALGRAAVDVVADVVAGPLFPALLNALKPKGRYVTCGAIAGPLVSLDLRTLYLRHLELIGSTLGTRDQFARLVALIAAGRVVPLVAATYPLSEIAAAQAAFKEKAFFGKLVLLPKE